MHFTFLKQFEKTEILGCLLILVTFPFENRYLRYLYTAILYKRLLSYHRIAHWKLSLELYLTLKGHNDFLLQLPYKCNALPNVRIVLKMYNLGHMVLLKSFSINSVASPSRLSPKHFLVIEWLPRNNYCLEEDLYSLIMFLAYRSHLYYSRLLHWLSHSFNWELTTPH